MTPLPDCTNTRELLALGDAAVYPVADVESLRAERDALKAKLDAMAEWAAKVPHAENCNSLCPYCEGLEADYHTACSVGPCSCHLSRIPSDLIARGKEIARDQKILDVINRLAGDDFCEDLDLRSDELTGDIKEAHGKLSKIYRVAHSSVRSSTCYRVHEDWRAEGDAEIDAAMKGDCGESQVKFGATPTPKQGEPGWLADEVL